MEPFLSEILLVSFNFAPRGFALCNGQLLPINQNQALFSLLGTTFGGDGVSNFGLPDLRGRCLIHVSSNFRLGDRGGEQEHTLSLAALPPHTHPKNPSATYSAPSAGLGISLDPENRILASHPDFESRFSPRRDEGMAPIDGALQTGTLGGSQAHTNMMPYLTLNYIIALQGIFPSPT